MKTVTVILGSIACFLLWHQALGDGVKQCYFCGYDCATTAKPINCSSVPGQTSVCEAHKIHLSDGTVLEAKECAIYSQDLIDTCESFKQMGTCYICFTDLCNLGW